MARLTGANRERERALQAALQDRISLSFRNGINQELRRESERLARQFTITGDVEQVSPQHAKRILALLQQCYTATIETFGSRILDQINETSKGVSPKTLKDESPDLWMRLVMDYMATRGAQKIADDIAQTTKNQIAAIVARGLENGQSVVEIGGDISAKVGAVATLRANTIARTETHGAAGFGSLGTAQQTGLQLVKEWIAARDERTRLEHSSADGQTVQMNDPFIVAGERLQYPGDPNGSAGNVINCRCASGYLTED